ncbi:MAG: hypothetical protein M0P64_00870 [Candidatus Pacebacteria bacterium]|jgi:Tfp pilus assembly protein PilV|nr:hypothetical protein [Candidatus Paceibacterota bacterium]
MKFIKNKGFGMLEVVVAVGVLATALLGISAYFQQSLRVSQTALHTTQAAFLLDEGIEAVRIFRDGHWNNISGLTVGTPYYLVWNGTTWATSTTPSLVEGLFDRTIVVSNVNRDLNQDIVTSGGTTDTAFKKATITVSWDERGSTITKTASMYIANMFDQI